MKIAGTSDVVCRVTGVKYPDLSFQAKSARFMKPYNHERCELIHVRIQPKGDGTRRRFFLRGSGTLLDSWLDLNFEYAFNFRTEAAAYEINTNEMNTTYSGVTVIDKIQIYQSKNTERGAEKERRREREREREREVSWHKKHKYYLWSAIQQNGEESGYLRRKSRWYCWRGKTPWVH